LKYELEFKILETILKLKSKLTLSGSARLVICNCQLVTTVIVAVPGVGRATRNLCPRSRLQAQEQQRCGARRRRLKSDNRKLGQIGIQKIASSISRTQKQYGKRCSIKHWRTRFLLAMRYRPCRIPAKTRFLGKCGCTLFFLSFRDDADSPLPASLFDPANLDVDHAGIRLLNRLWDIEA
jgi:hypothetical protein